MGLTMLSHEPRNGQAGHPSQSAGKSKELSGFVCIRVSVAILTILYIGTEPYERATVAMIALML